MRSASRRTRRSGAVVAGIAFAFASASTPTAVAGTLTFDTASGPGTLIYFGEAIRSHNVRVSPLADAVPFLDGVDDVGFADAVADVRLDPLDPRCVQAGRHGAVCDGASVRDLYMLLGNQADYFSNDSSLTSFACGAEGNDRLTGGPGRDILGGGPGRDDVAGGDGRDTVTVRMPEDLCGAGDGAEDGEMLDGGPGPDQVYGGLGSDVLRGGDGNDSVRGFAGDDHIAGGDGNDELAGFDGDDELAGEGANDLLFGGEGADRLNGGEGNDLVGGTARMDVDGFGGSSETVRLIETGDDVLDGGAGDDTLVAGPGEALFDFTDPLAAELQGSRDRTLQTSAPNGADVLRGGPGVDEVTYFNRAVPVVVTSDGVSDDGSPDERDRVDADVEAVSGGAGEDVLFARPEGSMLFGDLAADRLIGDAGPDLMRGGAEDSGADVVLGAGGDDDLAGGGGDDDLDGGTGRDAVRGDDGADLLRGRDGDDTLWGGSGADRLEGGAGADCLHGFLSASGAPPLPGCPAIAGSGASGADGDDVLAGGAGVDRLEGGPGDDVADYSDARGRVFAALPGADVGRAARAARWADRDEISADVEGARGGSGADTLLGNGGDNLLDGGPGADLIDGAAGADRLRGGPGPDVAVARDGDPDEIRCGAGRDLVVVDADDETVALRADVCELADDPGAERASRLARILGRRGCAARLRFPGVARSFDLGVATVVPWGTRIEPETCGAAVRPPGQRQGRAARVRGGAFSVERGRRGAVLTVTLRGGKPRSRCVRGSRAELRRLSVTAGRPLLMDGHYAEVRGGRAAWSVSDRCDGTRVSVQRGQVLVFGGPRGGSTPLRAPGTRRVVGRAR